MSAIGWILIINLMTQKCQYKLYVSQCAVQIDVPDIQKYEVTFSYKKFVFKYKRKVLFPPRSLHKYIPNIFRCLSFCVNLGFFCTNNIEIVERTFVTICLKFNFNAFTLNKRVKSCNCTNF